MPTGVVGHNFLPIVPLPHFWSLNFFCFESTFIYHSAILIQMQLSICYELVKTFPALDNSFWDSGFFIPR